MTERNASADSAEKRAAGIAASEVVESGMIVGLGTGSTVAYTIKELGRRVQGRRARDSGCRHVVPVRNACNRSRYPPDHPCPAS